jgi:signal transduction histidine kinase/ActR/RegA family two-component response regulator
LKIQRILLPFSIILFFISPFSVPMAIGNNTKVLALTGEEIQWLQTHPVIRVAPDPDFPPIEWMDSKGKHRGIAADYLKIIESKLPVTFEIVHLKNWNKCLTYAREKKIDMWAAAVPTVERLKYMRFTRPFVEFPAVIIVRESSKEIYSINELRGKRVAVVDGYADHEFMKTNHPGVNLITTPDIVSGLRLTSFGRVDAMILNIASASYYISKEGITNLKVTKDTGFIFDLSLAIRDDWPLLQSILDKTIRTITPEEKTRVMNRWVSLKRETWSPSIELLTGFISGILLIIIAAFFLSNRILRKQIYERTRDLHKELQERIKAEEEKAELQQKIHRSRKMEALGLLASGVAHDLNNILSGIINYPQLLMMKLSHDDPMWEALEAIEKSGLRAAAVVEDLLTIARDAATNKSVENINIIIQSYIDSPELKAFTEGKKDISIITALDERLFKIQCSATHIRKMIMNLMTNALEAIEENGSVTITTENCYLDKPISGYEVINHGDYVLITVSDTGPGIDKTDLDRIFEPFFTRKVMGKSGTGLGLTVVWSTVQDHNGYIDIKTNNEGTTFKIYLPSCRNLTEENVDSIIKDPVKGKSEMILVVDDEFLQRDIAKQMLHHLNFIPETASSGEEAVELCRKKNYQVILLDMIMSPGMGGRETFEALKAVNPRQKVVICSGFTDTDEVRAIQQTGTGTFLKKPYSMKQLADAISAELHQTMKE